MAKRTAAYITSDTADAAAREWLTEVHGLVRPRPHLVLEPDRCALLVVDMLHYFAAPEGRAYLPAAEVIVKNVKSLLQAWRARSGTVVFTRHCHESDRDLGMLGRFFSDHIRCGFPEAEIIPELTPEPHEPIFRKTTYDAFHGTDLEDYLRDRDVSQVLVAGVLTHMCCETTARAAFVRGFEVFVPVDATASSCELLHRNSLLSMADSVAVLYSCAEVVTSCGR